MGNERKPITVNNEAGEISGEFLVSDKGKIALKVFESFNISGIPLNTRLLQRRVNSSISQNACLEFIQFSCPRINAEKLSTSAPEEYILTDPKGNNFESTSGRLAKLIRSLNSQGLPSLVNVILVDTDESDYIFPVLGTPPNFDNDNAAIRKMLYFEELTKNIKSKYTDWLTGETYLWSAIRDVAPIANPPPNPESVNKEITRLTELFSPGNYYGGVFTPSDEQLMNIAKLKFSAYANQGFQISRYFPNAVLIQNEFPLVLRTEMLNLLNDPETEIPAIYPYGRSESPY